MLNINNSVLVAVDIQEKLVSMLGENSALAENKAIKLISAAKILGIETILTEQYPKGLGQTISSVKNILGNNYSPFEKTSFSILNEPDILQKIENLNKKQAVVFGIEAHICVFQTALSLFEKGYEVFVVEDACFSRNDIEKELSMKNLRSMKILTPSVESVLFMWLQTSKNPNFKEVQALIK